MHFKANANINATENLFLTILKAIWWQENHLREIILHIPPRPLHTTKFIITDLAVTQEILKRLRKIFTKYLHIFSPRTHVSGAVLTSTENRDVRSEIRKIVWRFTAARAHLRRSECKLIILINQRHLGLWEKCSSNSACLLSLRLRWEPEEKSEWKVGMRSRTFSSLIN